MFHQRLNPTFALLVLFDETDAVGFSDCGSGQHKLWKFGI